MLYYQEALNYSFVEAGWERDFAANDTPIKLLNPIASQLAVMRSTLIGSLVANVAYNLKRKATRVRMFEIAKIYRRNTAITDDETHVGGIEQPTRVAAIAYGPAVEEQWGQTSRAVDFFDVKNDVEVLFAPRSPRFAKSEHPALHPGRSARILIDGEAVGWIGELHPRWMQSCDLPLAPVIFEVDAGALVRRELPRPTEIARFPEVTRDLAFVVDQAVSAQHLFDRIDALRADAVTTGGAARHIREVRLFDEYHGKGLKDNAKSLAFRFRLQDTNETLDDPTIERALAEVTEALQQLGAALRT
jgi:phenylalanyl-tRNA synthetase beta chain